MLGISAVCILFPVNLKSLKTESAYSCCFVKQRTSKLHGLAIRNGSCQQPKP